MSTAPITQGPVDVFVGPVAFAVFADNGNIRIWSSASEPVRKLAEAEGMKLVPLYAIPEGWQLVPKEPTKEMMQAGFDVRGSHLYGLTYRSMLDAAPFPPNVKLTGAAPTEGETKP